MGVDLVFTRMYLAWGRVTLRCKLCKWVWWGLCNLQTFFGLYNLNVNTSKQVLFLPPSDAYVRSFLYLLYTLIKLYYTKALSDQALSLAPDWILLLRGSKNPGVFAWFNNNLSITFLPRSKHLLISWLQSPSAVILEPPPPQNKFCHCFHCFPIYFPWSDGTRCHELSFLNVEF